MSQTLQAGQFYVLPIERIVTPGAYLRYGDEDVLLPNRYLPADAKKGDEIEVFIHHDSENRLIATTAKPHAIVGEFAVMKVLSTSGQGAFLDWGLSKDLFVPVSQQREPMKEGRNYLVYIYRDEKTGRVAATEWWNQYLKKDGSELQAMQAINMLVHRRTPLGFAVIVDNMYEGLVHDADAVVGLKPGQLLKGFIKQVREDGKLDVVPGKRGYEKISGEPERILELLQQHKGALPYNDKSDPQDIYAFFGLSKKAFKMAIGALYKQRLIEILPGGIKLLGQDEEA
jgi:predicted RNA-binding protein (virulence factor B family)